MERLTESMYTSNSSNPRILELMVCQIAKSNAICVYDFSPPDKDSTVRPAVAIPFLSMSCFVFTKTSSDLSLKFIFIEPLKPLNSIELSNDRRAILTWWFIVVVKKLYLMASSRHSRSKVSFKSRSLASAAFKFRLVSSTCFKISSKFDPILLSASCICSCTTRKSFSIDSGVSRSVRCASSRVHNFSAATRSSTSFGSAISEIRLLDSISCSNLVISKRHSLRLSSYVWMYKRFLVLAS
ncbi:hypothetical protein LELG_05765 [Lodderomyces elongisporus NRRL YB-4239]|uniref:Uncharacterized protein n=1 Tax=Lodderomyces elongisporus (strain ATCC 11503 / CBS 2605 / JCM 1781 / NBRC 1676 / NRRL YB-4239) TaxID=379508 RepID=A5H2Q0_LODEL|nr:hypothetical protein LELG_05765 [Lodderomyces elongisporus NRRL YB-4239]